MKRILLDQGMPFGAAQILRSLGWDAVHARDIGMAHEDDSVLLAYAVAHSRTIVTFDRDFPDLLAGSGETRPSIVFLRQQGVKAVRLAEVLQALWQQHEAEIEAGCIITINTRGARVRRLPT